jgi:hypothetical protein
MACGAISEPLAVSGMSRRAPGLPVAVLAAIELFKSLTAENCRKIKFARCRFPLDSMLPIGVPARHSHPLKGVNGSEACATRELRIEQNRNNVKTKYNAAALEESAARAAPICAAHAPT